MRIIDAHMHINFCGFSAESLMHYLDSEKIEKCWLHTWEEENASVPSLYQHLPIDEIFNVVAQYPDRIIPFYAPDPSSATFKADLEGYLKLGLKGCGELKVSRRWDDQKIEDYLKIVSIHKLPLVFHMERPKMIYIAGKKNPFKRLFRHLINNAFNGVSGYYISKFAEEIPKLAKHIKNHSILFPGYLYDFVNLEKRLSQFPDVAFIGHGPHFWNNIARDVSIKYTYQKGKIREFGIIDRLLEENRNLYCDISGTSGFIALTRDIDMTKIFLEKHADKILFGTDNTKYDLLQFLLSLQISPQKLDRILYKNAATIMGA